MEYTNEITELRTDSSRTYRVNGNTMCTVFEAKTEGANAGVMTRGVTEAGPCASMTTRSWTSSSFSDAAEHTIGIMGFEGALSTNRLYITASIPTLPRNPRIKRAELVLKQKSRVGNDTPAIGLCRVTDEAAGTLESALLDYEVKKNGEGAEYLFDITALTDEAYSSGVNLVSLAVKYVNESITTPSSVVLYGASSEVCKPEIRITYESSCGINSAYRTQDHSLGKFGEGRVDLACGNLTFESTDFAWAGSRMPVTIRRFYNSALSDVEFMDGFNEKMSLGCGWRLNLMQTMLSGNVYHEGNTYSGYIYTDELGNKNEFIPTSESGIFACTEDEDMRYNSANTTLTMGDMTYKFTDGRLTEIRDSHNNTNTITYTDNRITKVTDGAGREFLFSYSGNYLVSVKAPDLSEITYTYTEAGQLNSIVYPDGTRSQVTYFGDKPRQVILLDKSRSKVFRMNYNFNADRVTKHTEYGVENGDYVTGTATEYSYYAASNRSVVTLSEPADTSEGETEASVISTVYAFDDDGNVISEYAYSPQLENTGINGGDINSRIHYTENLLVNSSLKTLDGWGDMANAFTDIIREPCTHARAPQGKHAVKLNGKNVSAFENGIYQSVTDLDPGEYTFSAYAIINEEFAAAEGSEHIPGVYLRIVTADNTIIAESEHISAKSGIFERIMLPFTLTSSESIKVQMLINGNGKSIVCAPQLERGRFAGEFNMLVNSNFENQLSGWETSGSSVSISNEEKFRGNSGLAINGSLDRINYAHQKVLVKTKQPVRETFTLSGWAKATNALPDRDRDNVDNPPAFRLRATVKYGDDIEDEYHIADFSPCTDEWQYVSLQFAKEEYRQIKELRISCDYGYNVGTAYFDCIQLTCNGIEYDLDISDFYLHLYEDLEEWLTDTEEEETLPEVENSPEYEELADKFGNTLTSTTFTDGELGTVYTSSTYDEKGNNIIIQTDARGKMTKYTVDPETSRNTEVTDRCGNKTAYEYDASGKTAKVTSKKSDDTEIANVSYSYDTFDNMTEIVRGDGMKYVLGYNAFHELETIGVDGTDTSLIRYDYKNGNGRLKSMTYANGDKMKATYNALGQMIAENWYDINNTVTAKYKYVYDNNGNIVRTIDIISEKEYNYTYEDNRLVKSLECNITLNSSELVTARTVKNTVFYVYDTDGNMTRKVIQPACGNEQIIYYEHPENGNAVVKFDIKHPGDIYDLTVTSHSKTDSFGRKVFDEIQHGLGVTSRHFSYYEGKVTEEHAEAEKYKSAPTTSLVKEIVISSTGLNTPDRILSYEYDNEERITKVTDSLEGVTEYTYDALGQLLSETVNGTVINSMTYDSYGNILTKNGKTYVYDTTWKDKLVSYDGQAITYDAQGNPEIYLGHTLEWEKGRQLKKFDDFEYTYNANGIRTSKKVDGIKHVYTLEGTKILREEWGTHTLIPLYDNEDSVCGIRYDQFNYFFIKNLQGDVIAITDPTGTVCARYTYDAWGKCTVNFDNTLTKIGDVNPFRYRGYYYDDEIGMYYLQSRYYDPKVGRFVNGDSLVYSGAGIIGFNMYTYCGNEPIDNADYSGRVLVSIRAFVKCRNGSVFTAGREATFKLNGYKLIVKYNGENKHNLNVKNKNGTLFAHNYDLAYYFLVKEWTAYFYGFRWKNFYNKNLGFSVKTTSHFLNKKFCMDFAHNILKVTNSNNKYCGLTKTQLANELYAHAVLFHHSDILDSLTFNYFGVYDSGKWINIDADDPRAWIYWGVWNIAGPITNSNQYGNLFEREYGV